MRILAVDDEPHALRSITRVIKSVIPDCEPACFDAPEEALKYAKENRVDIAFLDIEMAGMNGLTLAKCLKDNNGNTNVVFVTGHSQYALDAYSVNPSGYLLKPVTKEAIQKVLDNLRHPVTDAQEQSVSDKRVRIQTFGNFDVYIDGKHIRFANSKTKELLAYLVYREGALCNLNEIIAVIWEDKEDTPALKSYYQNLVADLIRTFSNEGIDDLVIKQRGFLGIDTNLLSCDFYDFCAGINVNSYKGEFMNQYGWAEFTNESLERMLK